VTETTLRQEVVTNTDEAFSRTYVLFNHPGKNKAFLTVPDLADHFWNRDGYVGPFDAKLHRDILDLMLFLP
jgi:hypothetical protein